MIFDLLDEDTLGIILSLISLHDAASLAVACRTLAVDVGSRFLGPLLLDAQRELRARLRLITTDAWVKTARHADWREADLSLADARLLAFLCLPGRPLMHLQTVQLSPYSSTDFELPVAELAGRRADAAAPPR